MQVIQTALQDLPSSDRGKSSIKAKELKTFSELLKKTVIWCSRTNAKSTIESTAIASSLLEVLQTAESLLQFDIIRHAEADSMFAAAVNSLDTIVATSIQAAADNGQVHSLQHFAQFRSSPAAISQTINKIFQELFEARVRLQPHVQQTLVSLLDKAPPESEVILSSAEVDSPHTIQLASALLAAWRARADGPAATESFEAISAFAGGLYAIHLGGVVGSVEVFNRRLHEPVIGDSVGELVEIVQPFVEIKESAIRSPSVRPMACVGTKTHFARVGCARHNAAS